MKKLLLASTLTTVLLLGACAEGESNLSPQEIIDQAVQETTSLTSYYGEYNMDMDGELLTVKEWVKDGKRRIELQGSDNEHTISVNDGQQLTMLDLKSNTAQQYDFSSEGVSGIMGQSPKEQASAMLNLVEDTHTIAIEGEEKIAGRDTYHIVATAEEDSLIGDVEIWVDKENWMTLKSITSSADVEMVSEYTKFEINPEIDDTLFVLEIPEGVTVEQIETDVTFEQVELDEVKAKLGVAFLVFNENDLTLEGIQNYGFEDRVEYAFDYSKDGEKWLALSILPTAEEPTDDASLGGDKVTVRGVEGEQLTMGDFRMIAWDENGITYNVIIEHPGITFEEVYALIEKMELAQ